VPKIRVLTQAARGIEPEFAGKKLPPLQAADLLAWRTRNPLEEAFKPSLTREKADGLLATFGAAWKKFKHEAFYGDKEILERFCVDNGINPRR